MIVRLIGGALALGVLAVALGVVPGSIIADGILNFDEAGLTAASILSLGAAEAAATSTLPAPLSSLLRAKPWLNTSALRADDLRGKVVLVNFWTYSCINSLRPLPYLRGWAEKYRDRGLVVIGVHAPEFEFEKDLENVRRAIAREGVGYPVEADNDLAIWRAFGNRGWPGFYFIGADGRVRGQSLGEGDYGRSERLIQKLLAEVDGRSTEPPLIEVRGEGAQAAPDWNSLRSSEAYIGYNMAWAFASPGGIRSDAHSQYKSASALALNQWDLSGGWTVNREYAKLDTELGSIRYRFHARDLHMVLGAPPDDRSVRFRIKIDGAVPGADHGSDVDADGWGIVRQDRLYQLVRLSSPVRDRTFEIEFSEPGVRAYSFTFG